jgi:hypothetical protein
VVAEETLSCLLKMQQPGLVDAYLGAVTLDDPDPVASQRKRRISIAFLAGLGEPATNELCHALETGGDQSKWLAARALPAQAKPAADACIVSGVQSPDPAARAAAAPGLRFVIGAQRITPVQAWPLVESLARDADPRVRTEAIPLVAMFDFKHAIDILTAMGEKDGDTDVQNAARRTTQALRNYRFMNPDRTY